MKKRLRVVLAVGLIIPALFLSGCLFNIFQTAATLGQGKVAATIGSGLLYWNFEGNPAWSATPQARVSFGLTDNIDFGLQTGAMIPLSTGDPGWLGAKGDFKFLVTGPESAVKVALGFGGGYGIEFLGWGLFGELFLDVGPFAFAYQPTLSIADGVALWHHIAGGLRLVLSPNAALLVMADYRGPATPGLISFVIGIEIGF